MHADLGQEFFFDPDRHFDAQRALVGVPQHQGAPVCSGRRDGDLQHPVQQAAPIEGEVVGFQDLAQRVEQIGFRKRIDGTKRIEQPRESGRRDLNIGFGGQPLLLLGRRLGLDHGCQLGCRERRVQIIGDAVEQGRPRVSPGREGGPHSLARSRDVGRYHGGDLDFGIGLEGRNQLEAFVRRSDDEESFAHTDVHPEVARAGNLPWLNRRSRSGT